MKISNSKYQRLSDLKEEAKRHVIALSSISKSGEAVAYWEGKETGLSIALQAIEDENV